MRRRRSEPTSIRVLLSRWLSRRGMQAELMQYEIWLRWPDLVGDRLAAHTEPGTLKKGQLTVRVGSAPWLHELSFLRADLVQRINTGLGEEAVREVRLLAGPIRQRRRRAGEPTPGDPLDKGERAEPLPAPLLDEAELAAAPVEDEALRQAVRRASVARLRSKL